MHSIRVAVVLFFFGMTACLGRPRIEVPSASDGGPSSDLGHACTRNADCASGACLALADGRNVCTTPCSATASCVGGWSCGSLPGQVESECLCTPSMEQCDGIDNDCNGVIDDRTVTDDQCQSQDGARYACDEGTCELPRCSSDGDCLSGELCDPGTQRCRPLVAVGEIDVCLVAPETGVVINRSCFPKWASTPPAVAFGSVAVGGMLVRQIRVVNDGHYSLQLDGAHIEVGSSDFSLVGGPSLSVAIAPGEFFDVTVQFTPTTRGPKAGTLVLPSNDAERGSVWVPLNGTGLSSALCLTTSSPLDFGAVRLGNTKTLPLTLTNCSEVPLNITQLSLVNDPVSSTAFANATPGILSLPIALPRAGRFTINVAYAPLTATEPSASGDAASVSIVTEFETVTVPLMGRGKAPCHISELPSAVLVARESGLTLNPETETVSINRDITLDGSTSTSPSGTQVNQYEWHVISQPAGSNVMLASSAAQVTFNAGIPGDYVIELAVANDDMCQSSAESVVLHVQPPAILVELTWPQSFGDLDLHYLGPGGGLFQRTPTVGDMYYLDALSKRQGMGPVTSTGNTIQDFWGLNNSCQPNGTMYDDATLDIDQSAGYGPETVSHKHPFDGTYKVAVHDYCSVTGNVTGTITPHVRIYVNGSVAWEGSFSSLPGRRVWEAAQIVVSDNGTTIQVVPLSTPLYSVAQGC